MAAQPSLHTSSVSDAHDRLVDGLKRTYHGLVEPLEEQFAFRSFFEAPLRDVDIEAKPMILLIGQYSVGKTSFIRYLLGKDFPGMHIGPEPTTDRFIALMGATNEETLTPGQAACVSSDKPWHSLQHFGSGFLSHFAVSEVKSPLLENVTLIDTPGVLSGEKQRLGRSYEFTEVVAWFADRADVILCLFDAHKLDISDEFKRTLGCLRGNDDKVRIVLNKADSLSKQQLVRVYGAMMWSLGKVFDTPEVKRVYIGSFWDQPLQREKDRAFFEAESADLLHDLAELPARSSLRKVNEFVKRVRLARVHALVLSHLRGQMPSLTGKAKKQRSMIAELHNEFNAVHRTYNIPVGDFPALQEYKQKLEAWDFMKFPKLNKQSLALLAKLEQAIEVEIPALIQQYTAAAAVSNPFETFTPEKDVFVTWDWTVSRADKAKYDKIFATLDVGPDGYASADSIRKVLMKSQLPFEDLSKIWRLCNISNEVALDDEEFAVAMYLAYEAIAGRPVPGNLDPLLVPPSKRQIWEDSYAERRMKNIRANAAASSPRASPVPGSPIGKAAAGAGGGGGGGGGGFPQQQQPQAQPQKQPLPATPVQQQQTPTQPPAQQASYGGEKPASVGPGAGFNAAAPFGGGAAVATQPPTRIESPPVYTETDNNSSGFAGEIENPFAPATSGGSGVSASAASAANPFAPEAPGPSSVGRASAEPQSTTNVATTSAAPAAGGAAAAVASPPPRPSSVNNPFASKRASSGGSGAGGSSGSGSDGGGGGSGSGGGGGGPPAPKSVGLTSEEEMVAFVQRLMRSGKAGSFTFVRSELGAFRLLKMSVEAREWIEAVLGRSIGSNLAAALRSGVVLCDLANAIVPGSVKTISKNEQAFYCMQNISAFISAAVAFGVDRAELFEPADLRTSSLNLEAVVNGIHACAAVAADNGFTPVLVRKFGADFSVEDIAGTILALKQSEAAAARQATIKLKKSGPDVAGGFERKTNSGSAAAAAALTEEDRSNEFAFKLDDVMITILQREVDNDMDSVIRSTLADETAPPPVSGAADHEAIMAAVAQSLDSIE